MKKSLIKRIGISLPPSQFEGLFLSTKHTEAHIDQTIEAARHAFAKLKK